MENNLTVIAGSGLYIMGKLNGTKLLKPRMITTFIDEKDKQPKINLSPLPLTPPYLELPKGLVGFVAYPVPSREKQIIELYERVTHITVDPG